MSLVFRREWRTFQQIRNEVFDGNVGDESLTESPLSRWFDEGLFQDIALDTSETSLAVLPLNAAECP